MTSMKQLLVLVMAILFIAAGCASNDTANGKENNKSDNNDVSNQSDEKGKDQANLQQLLQQLEMTANVKPEADQVTFDFKLKNTGDKPVELGFSSGQQYEIVVKNNNGDVVYRYSKDKAFTEAFVYEEVKPGKEMTWQNSWNYKQDSKRVDAGTYSAEITVLPAQLNKQTIDAKPFQMTQTFDVPSSEEAFRNVEVTGKDGQYTVKGEARVYEGQVEYMVEDGHMVLVEKSSVQASQGAPNWGTFEFNINIEKDKLPGNGTLTLTLFTTSPKDGSMINLTYIPLETFKPE